MLIHFSLLANPATMHQVILAGGLRLISLPQFIGLLVKSRLGQQVRADSWQNRRE
jgi:hypothetical protein